MVTKVIFSFLGVWIAWCLSIGTLAAQAGDQAAFVSQAVPSVVRPGEKFQVTLVFKNTGSTTWTKASFWIGAQKPSDNGIWGPSRTKLPVNTVAPGESVTFTIPRTAPAQPGTYNFQMRLINRASGKWFGDPSQNVKVVVNGTGQTPILATQTSLAATVPPSATRTRTATLVVSSPTRTRTQTPVAPSATRTVTPTGIALTATRTATTSAATALPPPGCTLANLPPPAANSGEASNQPIGVRVVNGSGEFYDRSTGEKFEPRGFNYVRLASQVGCYNSAMTYHSTFNAGSYNANQVEQALTEMQGKGFNALRVFINSCCANGIGNPSGGLSNTYLGNLADFLTRARAHDIHVILTIDSLPELGGYIQAANLNNPPQIQGTNRPYLSPNYILVQKRFWQDLIRGLRLHNAPLEIVMTYELQNEAWFSGNLPPFTLNSGTLTPANGQVYNLANPMDKLRLADEGLVYWVTQLRAAILELEPNALVSVGIFPTSPSDGTTFVNRYLPPARMIGNMAQGGAPVDWVDLHLYPDASSFSQYARFMGFETARQKPLVLGEFGSYKTGYTNANFAADGAQAWQTMGCAFTVTGWLFYTYDTTETEGALWAAREASGLVETVISPNERPDLCKPWDALGTNVALNRTVTASVKPEIASKVVDGAPWSVWDSAAPAPQWIEIDLGTPQRVNQIRMVTQQKKSGPALHRVWRITPNAAPELLYEFSGTTNNGQVLDYTPPVPWENLQKIRVETITHPDNVVWREIEVFVR